MARARFARLMPSLLGLVLVSGITTTIADTTIANAASYTVTETALCGGAGSFQKILAQANANPGHDTIEFTPGIQVAAWNCNSQPADVLAYPLRADESLTILGHGATIVGGQSYINPQGQINNVNECPSQTAGTNQLRPSVGFLEVGTYGVDNTDLDVVVDDLNFNGMPSLFLIEKAASLTLTHSTANSTLSFRQECQRLPIESRDGDLTLEHVTINESATPMIGVNTEGSLASVINGYGTGALIMDHVTLDSNSAGRAVVWRGGSTTIANSLILESGGLWFENGPAHIVNTALYVDRTRPINRVVAINSAVRTDGSTFYFNEPVCEGCLEPNLGFATDDTGTFDFHTTAIGGGVDYPGSAPLLWGNMSGYTSDALTWVQPSGYQDAYTLSIILPNALTAAPGLRTNHALGAYYGGRLTALTPIVGTLASPGVLIDAVDPAECPGGGGLLNPIDSSCITTDVFGNPRWDSNKRRNIGAVQNVDTPHLQVSSVGDGTATVSWNRPTEPGSGSVTGYLLFYRPVGGGEFMQIGIPGADSVVCTVPGLTNGVEYEFEIKADYDSSAGPESNTVTAAPLGPISTPAVTGTGGGGSVQLSWTEPTLGGRTGIISYYVVYRPTGTTDWILGPGSITGRITTIPGLTPFTPYEFAVFATTDDGASSQAGTTIAAPRPEELPPTGSRTTWIITLAMILIVAGAVILRSTTRRQR